MSESLKTIDGLTKQINETRSVFLSEFVSSVSISQFDGEIASVSPFEGELTIYSQNPNSFYVPKKTITNISDIDLIHPNVVRYDSLNNVLWVADIGLDTIFKLNPNSLDSLGVYEQLENVISLASLGDKLFAKTFEASNSIKIYEISNSLESNLILEYESSATFTELENNQAWFKNLPSPSSLEIDASRNILWDFDGETIYKIDLKNYNLATFQLNGDPISSLDVHENNGDLVVSHKTTETQEKLVVSDSSTIVEGQNVVPAWVSGVWVTIDGATWVAKNTYVENWLGETNHTFTKSFEIEKEEEILSAIMEVSVDNIFIGGGFYLNDNFISSTVTFDSIDYIDIREFIQSGTNQLTFQVRNLPNPTVSGPESNPMGLIFKITLNVNQNIYYISNVDKDTGDKKWSKKVEFRNYGNSMAYDLDREINKILIDQKKQNLIPFSFQLKDNISGIDTNLTFSIPYNEREVVFDDLLELKDKNIKLPSNQDNAYVWEAKESQFTHEHQIYVDLLYSNETGFKNYSLRAQKNRYEFEENPDYFYTPKFSWENSTNIESESSVDENNELNKIFVGNSQGKWSLLAYNLQEESDSRQEINEMFFEELDSEITSIKSFNGEVWISTVDYLYKYNVDLYKSGIESSQEIKKINTNADRIELVLQDSVWTVQPFWGNVVKRNKQTLEIEALYEGFDSPYSLGYRTNFNEIIVRGSNFLWKIDLESNKISAFAGADDWKLTDCSISSDYIAYVMEKNSVYKIRVLNSDLYSMLFDYESLNQLSFTTWMSNKKLFLLEELEESENYKSINHVFDTNTKELTSVEIETQFLSVEPESSEIGKTNDKIKINFPLSGEEVLVGQSYIIKWISSESDSDNVSIDLLLNGNKIQTISSETKNSGVFEWNVDQNLELSSEYQIKITWKSPQNNPDNSDTTSKFIITDFIDESSESDLRLNATSQGVHFNPNTNSIVNILNNGGIGEFFVDSQEFLGFLPSSINGITANEKSELKIFEPSSYSKIRVFVGSDQKLNDKWDSGIIETQATSIYYGGGNNLELGKTYYFNIQFYDKKNGWSRIQTKEFKMIL